MKTDSIAAGVVFALILTVGQRAIGFVRGLLFCRFMSPQELGQWSLVWSFLMMLIPLAVLGLPGCFGRFSEYFKSRGQLGYFVSRVALASSVLTLIAAVAMVLMPESFSYLVFRSTDQTAIVYGMAFCIVMVSASNFLNSLMESLRQVRVVTLMRFLTGMIFATVGLGMVAFMENAAVAATVGFGISSLVGAIPAMWILYKYRSTLNNTGDYLKHSTMWARLAPFAVWLWVSNFFHNCFELSDRYMLLYCSPVNADLAQGLVGQYHSGRTIPLLLISVSAMLAGVLLPYMSANWEKNDRPAVRQQMNWSIKLMGISFTIAGISILMMAPFIFDTILQGRYDDGLAVLPMTLVYCIWFGLATVSQDYLWVAEKGKWTALAIFSGLAVNLLLNWFLIPVYGVHGAVLATTLSNAALITFLLGLNHAFGCKTDAGVWICVLVPLFLLLSPAIALTLSVIVTAIGFRSNLIFHASEKAEIAILVQKMAKRFGWV
jgi:O-antigen/teichoic acid export membrane protein